MSLDRARLIDLAASTGFRPETLEKVDRLVGLLDDVSRHPLLSRVLALKGGTALNLGFGPPRRLSVDLDFNYVGSVVREAMGAERPEIERAVERITRAQGYRVQQSKKEHAGHKYFLGYRNNFGSTDRVEIDLNYLHRVPLGPLLHLDLWRPDGARGPSVPTVCVEELCVGKLCALLDRALPRDTYDAIRLPVIAGARWNRRLRRLFIALAGTLARPLHDYGKERLAKVTEEAVRDQLHPMLSGADRPSAEQLRRECWAVLAPLLDLTEAEREYAERLQAGELRLELLFPDDDRQADLLRSHPALLWKVRSAKSKRSTRVRPRRRRQKRTR
jgi:predicted nucleotidyltransferase component of viral defense system